MSLYPIPSNNLTNPLSDDLNAADHSISYINTLFFADTAGAGEIRGLTAINGEPYVPGGGGGVANPMTADLDAGGFSIGNITDINFAVGGAIKSVATINGEPYPPVVPGVPVIGLETKSLVADIPVTGTSIYQTLNITPPYNCQVIVTSTFNWLANVAGNFEVTSSFYVTGGTGTSQPVTITNSGNNHKQQIINSIVCTGTPADFLNVSLTITATGTLGDASSVNSTMSYILLPTVPPAPAPEPAPAPAPAPAPEEPPVEPPVEE